MMLKNEPMHFLHQSWTTVGCLNNTLKSPQLIQSKGEFIFYLLMTSFRGLISSYIFLINRLDAVEKMARMWNRILEPKFIQNSYFVLLMESPRK